MTRPKEIGRTIEPIANSIQKIKKKKSLVFGWLKSNKCECKNTNGLAPLPTVVPQQICNPQRCVQRRDGWSFQFNVCLWLHDQCPCRVSVDVLVALLRGQNVLPCFPTGHLFPGAELL